MKRFILVCGLLILMMGIYISTVGSTYYSPDIPEDSICPFNFHVAWEPYGFYNKRSRDSIWRMHYEPKCSVLHSINVKYTRASAGAGPDFLARPSDTCIVDTGIIYYKYLPLYWNSGIARLDSAYTYLNEYQVEPLLVSYPFGVYHDSIIDSSGDTISFGDSSGYYWFWKILAERYNNQDPHTSQTPWGQRVPFDTGNTNQIRYFEICNEPEQVNMKGWGLYPGHDSIHHFKDYVQISRQSIRDNYQGSCCMILGPSVTVPLCTIWKTIVSIDSSSQTPDTVYHNKYFLDPNGEEIGDPFAFWQCLDDSGILDCFDIISVHCYYTDTPYYNNPDKIFSDLDSLKEILDSLAVLRGESCESRPIWLTEFGWQRSWWNDYLKYPCPDSNFILNPKTYYTANNIISSYIIQFCELYLSNKDNRKEWLKEVFYYALCHYPNRNCLAEFSDYSLLYRPYNDTVTDTLDTATIYYGEIFDPIPLPPFNILANIYDTIIPKIHLIYPDTVHDTFYLGDTINIQFNDVSDNSAIESLLVKIEIKISKNDTSWFVIDDNLDFNTYYNWGSNSWIYKWLIDPEIFSDSCKIRVTVTDPYGLRGISEAEEYFSIFKSYWFHQFDPYNLAWQLKWGWINRDFCNCIYEISDTSSIKYLASITAFDSTLTNPESSGVIGFSNDGAIAKDFIKLYTKNQFLKINSIVERVNVNGYIFVGQDAPNLFGCIKVIDEDLDILNERLVGSGQTFIVINVDGDSFLASGYSLSGLNKKIWMRKFYIRTSDNYPVYCNSWNLLSMPWENILGDLLSVIYDSDENCYVATGNKKNSGIFLIMVNPSGSLIDSVTYPSNYSWAGGIELIKDESDSTYVIVGKEWDDSLEKQAFILKYAFVDDSFSLVWKREFSNQINPWLQSFNSIFIDDYGDYIVAGTAKDSIYDYSTSLVIKIDNETGYLVPNCISAPLCVFYTDSINSSLHGKMIQTSDHGYIVGGMVCNTRVSPWIAEAGICKFDADSISEQYQNASNPFTEFPHYSVLLANSLFRDHSTIRFILPRQSHVRINVYNILGQRVRTLADDERQPGAYEIIWDGRDNHGTQVSSGSYFLRFEAGEFKTTKSLTVIR